MKVTIITATYNSEKYLEGCIQSILNQSYKNIEHIIIDGKSTDGTLSIIKKYESVISKWISEKDRGLYDALNTGMSMATGDIVGILNSDDLLASTKIIEDIVTAFQTIPIDSLYGDLEYVEPDDINKVYRLWRGRVYNRNLFKLGWMPAHPTFYVKRDLIVKYGGYQNHYFSAADYEFMCRYLYLHRVSSYYLPKLIVKMRRGGQSNDSLARRFRANRRDYLAMKKNGIPFPFLVSILKPLRKLPQYYKKA